ncbi:MAG: acyltransferase [Planctomycetaceae bacterium]|nr:acyltransferase [Planctomycetaceae bacterium]
MQDVAFATTEKTVLLRRPAATRSPASLLPPPVRLDHALAPRDRQAITAPLKSAVVSQHFPVLDTWRGTAITLLMVGHFLPVKLIDCGTLGVELFFVLSGFLMGRILFVKQTPLGLFYQRRISRIFPAAYTFLILVLAYQWYATAGSEPSLSSTASCLLFYLNYYVALDPTVDLGLPVGHFWSLCVEEHTYIFLSGLAMIHRRKGVSPLLLIGAAILASFSLSIVIGVCQDWDAYKVYWRSDCRAASILCGALAAYLVHQGTGRRKSYLQVPSIAWGLVAVAFGILFRLGFMPELVKHSMGTLGLATGLLLIAQHGRGAVWACPPLMWMGTISFSVYLWQQPFYHAVKRGEMGTVFAISASLIVGTISYFLVERPVRAWLNKRWA